MTAQTGQIKNMLNSKLRNYDSFIIVLNSHSPISILNLFIYWLPTLKILIKRLLSIYNIIEIYIFAYLRKINRYKFANLN